MNRFKRRKYCLDGVCLNRARHLLWRPGAVAALGIIWLFVAASAGAHGPEDEFADWYHSLRSPSSGVSCCSPHRDCVSVDQYRGNPGVSGGYLVLYEGEWLAVPPDAVLQRADNPTGNAVLCITRIAGKAIARCFVRASES